MCYRRCKVEVTGWEQNKTLLWRSKTEPLKTVTLKQFYINGNVAEHHHSNNLRDAVQRLPLHFPLFYLTPKYEFNLFNCVLIGLNQIWISNDSPGNSAGAGQPEHNTDPLRSSGQTLHSFGASTNPCDGNSTISAAITNEMVMRL